MTAPTIELFVESCASCAAPVVWCITEHAKQMPVDADPVRGGNLSIEWRKPPTLPLARVVKAELRFGRTDLHTSHFATCPHAGSWRRRRAA